MITRRNWFQAGAVALAATSGLGKATAAPTSATVRPTADYLHAARETARWIGASAQPSEGGAYWLAEPDHPELLVTAAQRLGVYSGNAGIILFLLQLGKATGDPFYLEQARKGARYLAAHWKELAQDSSGDPLRSAFSFYNGITGIAFSLTEVWKATGEAEYRDAAVAVNDFIVKSAKPSGNGVTWTETAALGSGDTGIILYLLYAGRALQDESYINLAARGGEYLLTLSQADPQGGLRWNGAPGGSRGLPKDAYFPNFEMGTAGVAYGLGRLYSVTREARFLDAAKQGALHIQEIATVQGDSALVYYRAPDKKDLYYLGYCHGPAGTARLFYELYTVTRSHEYLDWTERLARGITTSGIPEKLTPGMWNVVCQCCGSAAVSNLFLGLWAATHKPEYLGFAGRVVDQMLSRVTDFNDQGYRWYQAWTRVTPWVVNAETGYMIGAAGAGATLLHLHLAEQRKYEVIQFPDNPFPGTASA